MQSGPQLSVDTISANLTRIALHYYINLDLLNNRKLLYACFFSEKAVKPVIVRAPEDQTAVEQENYSFEAEITGIPQPTVQW